MRAERPAIVLHSFGEPGTGGPIAVVDRVAQSRLAEKYEFHRMHQSTSNGGIDVRRIREWVRFLRSVRPDMVHVSGLGNEGFHGVLAARLAGCRNVLVTVHGTHRDIAGASGLKHFLMVRVMEPLTLRMASDVATVCEFTSRRRFIAKHATKLAPAIVNGVDMAEQPQVVRDRVRASWFADPQDVVLVSVGRLSCQKGLGDLARALAVLPVDVKARVMMVVAGDGPDRDEIERNLSESGVRILCLGKRLDVDRLLAGADVFVLPSWHENLSVALLEAMASGLPAIATAVGGTTEVLRKGGGRLVPPHSPADLSRQIGMLVADRHLRRALGSEAKKVAASDYSSDVMLDSLDRTYRRILKGRDR